MPVFILSPLDTLVFRVASRSISVPLIPMFDLMGWGERIVINHLSKSTLVGEVSQDSAIEVVARHGDIRFEARESVVSEQ